MDCKVFASINNVEELGKDKILIDVEIVTTNYEKGLVPLKGVTLEYGNVTKNVVTDSRGFYKGEIVFTKTDDTKLSITTNHSTSIYILELEKKDNLSSNPKLLYKQLSANLQRCAFATNDNDITHLRTHKLDSYDESNGNISITVDNTNTIGQGLHTTKSNYEFNIKDIIEIENINDVNLTVYVKNLKLTNYYHTAGLSESDSQQQKESKDFFSINSSDNKDSLIRVKEIFEKLMKL